MQYGYFDNERREYVITDPRTPLPWINYLGSDEYCALMSNTAGGYSFYRDPYLRRILRYRYNNVPMDMGGRYIYLRDNDTKDFWSLTWQPVRKPVEAYKYECRHGMGYTRIKAKYSQIESSVLYFVPKGENNEIWTCEIKNTSDRVRNFSVFSFAEFCLYNGLKDQVDYQYILNVGRTEVEGSTIYNLTNYLKDKASPEMYRPGYNPDYESDEVDIFTYFSCSRKIDGYDTQKNDFFGNYGSMESPRAVVENKCNNSIARGWSPVGSHRIQMTMQPGEVQNITFVLGVAKNRGDEKAVIEKYSDICSVSSEMEKLKAYWDQNLSVFQVQTPDNELDTMANIWNQYQCRTTFNWSRSASYYESGIGRGMGFRDSCQDVLGFVHMIPAEARQRIIDIASTQFETGDAYHQYQPLNKKGNGGGFSDDHLWLIPTVSQYIKESGDFDILREDVPFRCGEKGESASLYCHLEKAIEFTHKKRGSHGLALMLVADWNDTLITSTTCEKSESVFTSMLYVFALREMIQLAERSDLISDAEKYKTYIDEMVEIINESAWDGQWYKRAFTEWGEPTGSKECKENQIDLLPQAWAVMAGVADEEKLRMAMDSLDERLYTEHGIVLIDPPYTEFNSALAATTRFLPGLKENGAVFCHSNTWPIIAETMLGRGEQAYKFHRSILPSAKNEIAEIRKVEPYVYCQMVGGKGHTILGEGKNSWLTGTAAWSFFAVSSYIVGVRADYEGLTIDPCIPSEWESMKVYRKFRGAEYEIIIKNPHKVCKGIKSMKVNGENAAGNLIAAEKGRKYFVEVEMG